MTTPPNPSWPEEGRPGGSSAQPPHYGYPGPPMQLQTNGMAVASLVLGILWIFWIGSILALIFGYVARNQIRERNQGGYGLAIAGIVLGWVGVGTLALYIITVIIAVATGPH
jgi:hypothetical protein